MKGSMRFGGFAVLTIGISSCAHTPNVEVGYYLAKTTLSLKVVRTVACNKDNKPSVVANVEPIATYVADTRKTLRIGELESNFSKTSTKVNFYSDGRLSGLNATSEGQGEAILRSLAGVISPFLIGEVGAQYPDECKYVATHGDEKSKTLTLTYHGDVDLSKTLRTCGSPPHVCADEETRKAALQKLEPALDSSVNHHGVVNMLGDVYALVLQPTPPPPPVTQFRGGSRDVMLELREPAKTQVFVVSDPDASTQYWNGEVLAGQLGTDYKIPIPKAAAFGAQDTEIAVAESGVLTLLHYGKTAGASSALDAMALFAKQANGPTTAERAAAVKAEADLIAQQQRLAQCKADPTTCK